eukprot:1161791-Pelagomonas_calceolata.AAC.4
MPSSSYAQAPMRNSQGCYAPALMQNINAKLKPCRSHANNLWLCSGSNALGCSLELRKHGTRNKHVPLCSPIPPTVAQLTSTN